MKAIVCALVMGFVVPSLAGAAIENIRVSNNNFVAITISWTTDSSVMGEVHYSENPDLSNAMTAYDVRNQFFSGCTHYVEITGLRKETIYYFEVRAGSETDDNGRNYYSFRTTKEPQSPPIPCTISGCVYEEDGSTLAVGSMVYLWVTHGGVESYPLSGLLGRPGDATPGCFAIDIKQARSTANDDLFPSIDPGDPIRVIAIGCGDYTDEDNLLFDGNCLRNIGSLTLEYTPPGTTTTSAPVTTTSAPETTTSAPVTTTSVPVTTTSVPVTTTSVPVTTTSVPVTTTSAPVTTTSVPVTTTSAPVTTTSAPGGGCTTDAECDDGVYCNGTETCVPESGCQPGSPPCAEDGEYCNGVESCNEEADVCVSSGDPCKENEICREDNATCEPAIAIEASITGCGFPLTARLGVVEIQGAGTDFTARSVVKYDSPLVIKSLKLLNRNTQTITQFVLLMPSIFFPSWNYPATVTVMVDTLSGTLDIPACGR